MRNLYYPVLLYPLQENAVLGLLLSPSGKKVVGKSEREVLKLLYDFLFRQYKKSGEFEDVDREEVRMRTYHFSVKPTFQDQRGHFPASEKLEVPVTAIYGFTRDGFWECDLPQHYRGW